MHGLSLNTLKSAAKGSSLPGSSSYWHSPCGLPRSCSYVVLFASFSTVTPVQGASSFLLDLAPEPLWSTTRSKPPSTNLTRMTLDPSKHKPPDHFIELGSNKKYLGITCQHTTKPQPTEAQTSEVLLRRTLAFPASSPGAVSPPTPNPPNQLQGLPQSHAEDTQQSH